MPRKITSYDEAEAKAKERTATGSAHQIIVQFTSSAETRYRVYAASHQRYAIQNWQVGETAQLIAYVRRDGQHVTVDRERTLPSLSLGHQCASS